MNLDCLTDYIGIITSRKPGAVAPESGRYINTLPGINLKNIDAIASGDQGDYLGVWNDVQARAIEKLSLDVALRFQRRYRLKKVHRALDLGKKFVPAADVAPESEYRGFAIENAFKNNFNLVYSNLMATSVVSISIYFAEIPGEDIDIKIADMDTGETLKTLTLAVADMVAGWNLVKVNSIFSSQRIFIGYDGTNVHSKQMYINPNINQMYGGWMGALYGSAFEEGFIRGAKTIDNDVTNPVYGINSYGISAVFNILCSYDQFICNTRQSFIMPLLYLCGAELMIERLASDRINRYTTIDKEKADEMSKYYHQEYDLAMSQVIDSIDLNTKDVCIECNDTVRYMMANF